jgi:hypothetical protein
MRTFAERYGAETILTSAKTGTNIALLFDRVFTALTKVTTTPIDIPFTPEPEPETVNKSCCCWHSKIS